MLDFELLRIFPILFQMKESKNGEFYHKVSELFECEVSLEEVSDVLCIAQAGKMEITCVIDGTCLPAL